MNHYLTTSFEHSDFLNKHSSFLKIYRLRKKSSIKKWLWATLIIGILILLLPWTQNVRGTGTVTTLRQEQRPQQVNTVIAGSVLKWWVKEGDFVKKGDTILQLGEVKDDYFDSQLLPRTNEQIRAKKESMDGYRNKASTTITQYQALTEGRELKLRSLENKMAQQELKVKTEEAELQATQNELEAYKRQINAGQIMLDSGAISLVDFEKRKINYQDALAKVNRAGNELLQARQELNNLKIEQMATIQDFTDKIAKAEGERYSSLSIAASTEAELSKLQNQYANYDARNKLYFITASQSGQITKAKKAGLGEFIKEGEMIVEIVPDERQFAVEMFVKPMDLPLIHTGQKVRFVFDGFPAIVFSGWPTGSYGTFGGVVTAVETSISANGLFRILVTEDPQDRKWPSQLRIGGGVQGIALLKDVQIFYELWRNINGFPPEFYQPVSTNEKKK